ncbi:MAG: MvdC/MvdD family ATP grasp protein [Candidatus Saccharimonadales bacterium]
MGERSRTGRKQVLIASSSLDASVWEPVARVLIKSGYDVITYEADKVADGRIPLELYIDQQDGLRVKYGDRQIILDNLSAAWYRRPNMFSAVRDDIARQLSRDAEQRVAQYALWDAVPSNAWLNNPRHMSHAEHKITQLITARAVGFTIPYTIVSNKWASILDGLGDRVIFKSSHSFWGDYPLTSCNLCNKL